LERVQIDGYLRNFMMNPLTNFLLYLSVFGLLLLFNLKFYAKQLSLLLLFSVMVGAVVTHARNGDPLSDSAAAIVLGGRSYCWQPFIF
jgi:hypothetical protein